MALRLGLRPRFDSGGQGGESGPGTMDARDALGSFVPAMVASGRVATTRAVVAARSEDGNDCGDFTTDRSGRLALNHRSLL
ncbi:MAG: hypothetical protein WEB06_15105 [Actinomycetota bacterium]